jgi:hypothetical protein
MYGTFNKKDWSDLSTPSEVMSLMDQKALVVLMDKIVRITLEWGQCLLLGWTIQTEPSLEGTNAFNKTVSRWDVTNSLSPITLPSAIAWVGREGVIHPSTVLLRAIATAVLDGTVRGYMIKVGTLLMVPEGELDENIHKLRSQNPLGIEDLRQVNIDVNRLEHAGQCSQRHPVLGDQRGVG